VNNFKNIIKTKLNIRSLKCDYIVNREEFPNAHNYYNNSNNDSGVLICLNGKFVYQNGNFRKTIIIPEKEKKDDYRNLIELLILKITPKKDTIKRFQQNFYFYKGSFKSREYDYDDFLGYHQWEFVHDNFDPLSLYYDPLVNIGYCHGVGYRGNNWMEENIIFNIKDFLDEEGDFLLL
ncbi:MAG: hypothetical protein ACP5KS_11855, partial [Candidatus Hydrogenedens sp.]